MGVVKVSFTTLKPLHLIAKFLGIWPSYDPITMTKCRCHYIYGVLVLVLIIINHIYGIVGKFAIMETIERSLFVTLLLADFATTATNISTIININFIQGERLRCFMERLKDLETVFKHVKKEGSNDARHFYVELVLGHTLYVLYMGYNSWQWSSKLGWSVIGQYALLRDLQYYHIFISVMLIRNYVLMINCKLRGVNYVLGQQFTRPVERKETESKECKQGSQDNILPNSENILTIVNKTSANFCRIPFKSKCGEQIEVKQEWDLEYISKTYTKLSNVINEFNEIFGWNLVVYQIQLIANLLFPLNLALIYGNGETIKGTKFDYNLYILCFIWFMIPLCHMLTVISACDRAKQEASKMPTVCYNVMMQTDDKELIKRLKNLAVQGHLQAPEFSAAGFFNFNYSLVFPTVTSIISYFIVLIQFNT